MIRGKGLESCFRFGAGKLLRPMISSRSGSSGLEDGSCGGGEDEPRITISLEGGEKTVACRSVIRLRCISSIIHPLMVVSCPLFACPAISHRRRIIIEQDISVRSVVNRSCSRLLWNHVIVIREDLDVVGGHREGYGIAAMLLMLDVAGLSSGSCLNYLAVLRVNEVRVRKAVGGSICGYL